MYFAMVTHAWRALVCIHVYDLNPFFILKTRLGLIRLVHFLDKLNAGLLNISETILDQIFVSVNTFTATDDYSRFYRSLPPMNAVVLRVYRYVPGYRMKVLRGCKCIVYQIFQSKKAISSDI